MIKINCSDKPSRLKVTKFRECKDYIYEQISNFEEVEKKGFDDLFKWAHNRKNFKSQINDINNIGKIYSVFNQINKHFSNFDIHTIQLPYFFDSIPFI